MEPVAAIPTHLADNFHYVNDIHGFLRPEFFISTYDFSKFAKIR